MIMKLILLRVDNSEEMNFIFNAKLFENFINWNIGTVLMYHGETQEPSPNKQKEMKQP